MKQFVVDVYSLMVYLLRNDNEDIGIMAVKITVNINRTYKALLDSHAMPFVEFITSLYTGIEDVLERIFVHDEQPSDSPSASALGFGSEVKLLLCFCCFRRLRRIK
jgi:transformation/transcription domain-associated protein